MTPLLPRWPSGLPVSTLYRVRLRGIAVPCFATDAGHFAWVGIDGPCPVEVDVPVSLSAPVVRPVSAGLRGEFAGATFCFDARGPAHLLVENEGGSYPSLPPLFLFLEPPEAFEPPTGDVLRLAAGEYHEPDTLSLGAGETVWLEPGAVVDAPVRITRAPGARLCGLGWIRGRPGLRARRRHRLLLAQASDGIVLDGPLFSRTPGWTVVLGACDDAELRNLKILTNGVGQDGIDVCGCRRIRIRGCCLRTGDDTIVVKALDLREHSPEAIVSFERDVEDVVAERCVLFNSVSGNALEVGHELRAERVRGITFREIDIVGVHDFGAVFSIHAYDRAAVEDVLFERVRVDHHYDMLLDIRVSRSRFSRDEVRGSVRRVLFRDIDVRSSPYNQGYTKSIVGGWDESHAVEEVLFERFRVDGRSIASVDELELFTRYARGLVVRS